MRKKHQHKLSIIFLFGIALLGILGLQIALRSFEKAAFPLKYADIVERYAAENNLEEAFLYAVIRTESGFRPEAQSDADARGLMQMTEETFYWLKAKIAADEVLTFEDLYTPEVSIRFGAYFLAQCMQRYGGDMATAAAAYHSGMGKVDTLLENSAYTSDGKVLHIFPYAQMNNYVGKIKRNYQKYKTLYVEDSH